MRNRGHFKKFLASGRALLSAVVTVAVILGGVVLLPSAVRAEDNFNGFPNDVTSISLNDRYYSSGYIEKTLRENKPNYNRFATVTADGKNLDADSYAFCLANGKKFPTYKEEGKAEGIYSMVRNIDEDMYNKLLAENHKFSHIANKKLAWDTFSRLTYIYLADPTGIVKRVWGKEIGTARDAFHQVIQLEIWRYTDGFLVSPTQNYFEYKYLSNEQKKALELVRQDLWNFAVPYDKLEYRFYKPEFKRGAGYQALGTVRFKKNDITVNKVWINLDSTDKKPDTYVRLLNDRKPVMVTDPGTGKQKEAVQKIDSEADQAVFEGEFNLDSGIWEVEEVMPDGKGGWKHWEVPGYTSDNLVRFDGRHCTITNTKQPNPKVVKVRKFWFNMGESTAVPDDVYFTLYKNGTKVADPKKLEKNAVSVEFPIDNSADIKQYTVKETDATGNPWKKDGYDEPVITKVLDGVFEVSNEKKDPPKIKVKVKKVDKDQPDKLLVGANLMIEKIYKQDVPSKYPDADWQTTGKVDEVELPVGDYKLSEQEPPLGYKKAANIYFKVDDQGKVTVSGTDPKGLYVASIDKTITMADEKDTTTGSKLTDVTLSKKAVNGTDELPGAKLQVVQIVSKQGQKPYSKLVAEWTSDKDKGAKTIKLPEGEYMMVETTAPNGYEVAESITFKVDAKGKVSVRGENGNFVNQGDSTVTMIDKPKQPENTFFVNLSKKAVNGTAELPGAKLKVLKGYSENGQLVEKWTSGTPSNSSKKIRLAPGVYTMVETTAPNGYEVAESITFKVDANGKVSIKSADGKFVTADKAEVVMFDKPKQPGGENPQQPGGENPQQPGKKYKVTFPKGAETSEDDPDGKNTTLKIVEGEDPNGQTTVGNPWNPGTEDKITDLKPGTYTLVKVVKKDGGKDVTETVTFKVDNNGEISVKNKDGDFVKKDDKTITTKDKEKTTPQQPGGKHKVTFPKDAETSEDDPKGEHTTLKIVEGEDPNGNTTVGESWKPGKEDKNVDLKPGTYTLVKVVEKDGRQEVTESVTFKVDTNGEILVKNKDGKYVKKDGNTITTKDKEKTTPQQPGEEPSQNHGTLFPPVILQQPGSTDTSQQAEVTKKTAKLSSTQGEVTPQADVPKTGEATTQPILPVFLTLAGLILVGVVVRRQKKQAPTKD
ncbi:LPXTG-motif cell wall anchor domain protein [Mageeibacillus indolicus UPII9-5]|uniref:LPXTG-motif cell wall anchor domain protein n=1 Tax=Mageeibacillus indolicus (strain UPII9-5) TaxID=699246 RepID=D3R0C9_MAGIU|nr:thioester-forming surface-anchored protein [Mageeibacillus indolicus]ADC91030.1 LPXTG-motif cell wall anchor domain protein [Mageeibacillus indolicus UPII9-5]